MHGRDVHPDLTAVALADAFCVLATRARATVLGTDVELCDYKADKHHAHERALQKVACRLRQEQR